MVKKYRKLNKRREGGKVKKSEGNVWMFVKLINLMGAFISKYTLFFNKNNFIRTTCHDFRPYFTTISFTFGQISKIVAGSFVIIFNRNKVPYPLNKITISVTIKNN